MSTFHLIIYVPLSHTQKIRDVLAHSGAGHLGNYDSCSFSSRGIGRFRPLKGANPHIGTEGKIEEVEEERIEVLVTETVDLQTLLKDLRGAHPYEEPAIHVLPMVEG